MITYLAIQVGNDLGVMSRHDRAIKPGIVGSCEKTLGRDFGCSANLDRVVLGVQDNTAPGNRVVLVCEVYVDCSGD